MKALRVRLLVDLTRYHPALRAGAEGFTIGQSGMWSRGSDRFVGVRFNEAGLHDILWESLEILDEEYLREQTEAREKERQALKTARNAGSTRIEVGAIALPRPGAASAGA